MPKRFPEWVNTEVVIKGNQNERRRNAFETAQLMDRKFIGNRKKMIFFRKLHFNDS